MKIIVTGGAGFIGSHLVEKLVDLDKEIIVLDNFSTGKKERLLPLKNKIDVIECDLVDFESLESKVGKLKEVEFIYHLAAIPRIGKSIDSPMETHNANVTATISMLEVAKKLSISRFFFMSSSSVYGIQEKLPLTEDLISNPQNPYAAQKQMGEIYCDIYGKVFNIKTTIFRPFNVYGPRMSVEGTYKLVFAVWLEQLKRGEPLTIFGDGEQTRDFTHVFDVVSGLISGIQYNQFSPTEIFNLGAGKQVTLNYLASLFDAQVIHLPPRGNEERFKEADIAKAKSLLGWEPKISIEEGVQELIK